MTWQQWVSFHGTTFGFYLLARDGKSPGADAEMLRNWAGIFARQGFGPSEAREASEWLALSGEPPKRQHHLRALLGRLQRPPEREAAPEPSGPLCTLCGGEGRVKVPDLDRLAERKECVVYCRCPKGRWYRQVTPVIKVRGVECRVLTLEQVEEQCPDWRSYGPAWGRQRAEELAAHRQAEDADRTLGRLAAPRAFREALREIHRRTQG